MKSVKIFLVSALILVALGAATRANAQWTNGLDVHAGYTGSTLRGDEGADLVGGSIGVGYNIPLSADDRLSFRPGLGYTIGMKSKTFNSGLYAPSGLVSKIATTSHAITVPLHLKYAFELGDNASVYVFAGPQIFIGAKYNIEYTITPDPTYEGPFVYNPKGTISRDVYGDKLKVDLIPDGSSDNSYYVEGYEDMVAAYENGTTLSRFDIAASAGAGIRMGHVFLEAGYDYGLLNIDKGSGKIGQDRFNVSIGYQF